MAAKTPPPTPLTGAVTQQTWVTYDQNFPGVQLQSGKPFHFAVLPPAQYDPTNHIYPLMIWLHPDFSGNGWYTGGNSDPLAIPNSYEGQTFNSVNFLTNWPGFTVTPFADQSSGNDAVENWGGWSNSGVTGGPKVYSGDTGPNTFAVLAMVTFLESQYSIDPNRIYINGFSLGGIGGEYLMLKYNAVNGNPKVFAAEVSQAGVVEINGWGSGPTAAQISTMHDVPVWWFSGANDGQSIPSHWNLPIWQGLAGNSSYPAYQSNEAAARAGTSKMHLWLDPNQGHTDVDNSGNAIYANPILMNWLYAQTASGTTPIESLSIANITGPPGITVARGAGGSFTDSAGRVFTLASTGNGQVAINGITDTTTANVALILYYNGVVWEDAPDPNWWKFNGSAGSWTGPQSDPRSVPSLVVANTPFTVSGTIGGLSSVPTLQYTDNSGSWAPLPAGATVSNSAFSFSHPGVAQTAGMTVSVRDANATAFSATSNSFAVTAGVVVPEGLTINTITTQTAGSAFNCSGNIVGLSTTPTLQYQNNSGTWNALPAGATVTSTAFSFTNPPLSLSNCPGATGVATAGFTISGGNIYTPAGNPYVGRGINITDSSLINQYNSITSTFPGLNFIRVACYSYQSPSNFDAAVNALTALGIVMEFENHQTSDGSNSGGGQGVVFTGSLLTTESNWYASMATHFKSNPNVWFGTNNEPPGTGSALATWHTATYNAIRGTGATNPIMIDLPGGGVPSETGVAGGMPQSAYGGMTNVLWDVHWYGWISGNGASQAKVNADLASLIAAAQTITSANGKMPVQIGEYGPDCCGVDAATGAKIVASVISSGYGSGAWVWDHFGADELRNSDGSLTSYGQTVEAGIQAGLTNCTGGPTNNTVSVRDANNTSVSATSNSFLVNAVAAGEALTMNSFSAPAPNTAFVVSGSISAASSAPSLQYRNNAGAWVALPTSGTRQPYNQPGGNGSAWNTPFGNGAIWGNAGDADTVAIGGPNGNTGIINSPSFYGQTYWIGSAGNGQYTFSSNGNGRSRGLDSGSSISTTVHLPTGTYGPGPYPGDNGLVFYDPVNFPNRQYTFGGISGGIQPPGLQPGQGPFTGFQGEWDDATSDQFGEDADTGLSGFNVGAGMINACDVNPACNPTYPRIQHALRYATDATLLKENGNPAGSQTLKPNSWPQRLQDYQSAPNVYTGNLLAGTTIGIPITTAQPGGLNANCAGAFWTFQHYPLFFRDQAGGGLHVTVDQVADTSAWVSDLRNCFSQLVPLLRPLRNQHQTGQDFTAFPKNGPGTRVDTGPPFLVGTGTGGATVTATAFSFTDPGFPQGTGNTVSVRDANNNAVSVTSPTFTVGTVAVEALTVNSIAGQAANVSFTVSGAVTGAAAAPTLQYMDDATGSWVPLPTGATVTSTSYTFTHPGLGATPSTTVSIRDANSTSTSAVSNSFAITAAPVESLAVNAISSPQIAGTTFTVSGTVSNAPAGLVLQYSDAGGSWSALPTGFTLTGVPGSASFSFTHPGIPASAGITVSVRDAGNTSIASTSNSFVVRLPESANNTVVLTVGPQIVDSIGEVFTLTSSAQVAVGGVIDATTSNVIVLAYVNHQICHENSGHLWFCKSVAANGWPQPGTPTSPLPPESLTIGSIGGQTVGVPFAVSGGIGSALVTPVLQYSVSGNPYIALPASAVVTSTGFSFTIPGITSPGPTTVSVRDAGTPSILATSNSFNVLAVIVTNEILTMQPIANQPIGVAFPVSGSVGGMGAPPVLQYQDNGGGYVSLPVGATVTATGYNFLHPALPATQGMVVSVRDSASGVNVNSQSFVVLAQESQNLTTIAQVGPKLVDKFGISYSLTSGSNVAINGITDSSTNNVIELAYVNRSVWFENTALQWWSRSLVGTWVPTGGTPIGPVPSSRPIVYITDSRPLAVVPGFTIPVPGLQINDTVTGGVFNMKLTATDGVLNLPGGAGSGTANVTMTGSIGTLNAALGQLQFTGKTVGTGSIVIIVTDPAGATATTSLTVKVPRSAATHQPGRYIPY